MVGEIYIDILENESFLFLFCEFVWYNMKMNIICILKYLSPLFKEKTVMSLSQWFVLFSLMSVIELYWVNISMYLLQMLNECLLMEYLLMPHVSQGLCELWITSSVSSLNKTHSLSQSWRWQHERERFGRTTR